MASAKEKTKKLLEMMQAHLDDFIFEGEPMDLPSLVEGLDIYAKYMTLKQVDWNRAEAADLLGLKRGTLREWVLRYKEKLGIPASKGKPRGNTNKPSPYTGHGPKNIKRRKKQLDPEYCDWLDDRYGT